jgi:hypothetical protein
MLVEKYDAVVGQHDVPRAPALAGAHADRASLSVKIPSAKSRYFAVSTPGKKRALHQRSQVRLACIDQPPGFPVAQIVDLWSVGFTERFHPPPSLIGRRVSLAERKIERRLEHAEDPVGARAAPTHGIVILKVNFPDVLSLSGFARSQAGGRFG